MATDAIPDEAVEAFADRMLELLDDDPPRPELRECLAAALPSLRRRWAEGLVDDVAAALHAQSDGDLPRPWRSLADDEQDDWRLSAREVLGLDGEDRP